MNKKPPLTPPEGEDLRINDNMINNNKYARIEVSPWGDLEGLWRAATRNPIESLKYE